MRIRVGIGDKYQWVALSWVKASCCAGMTQLPLSHTHTHTSVHILILILGLGESVNMYSTVRVGGYLCFGYVLNIKFSMKPMARVKLQYERFSPNSGGIHVLFTRFNIVGKILWVSLTHDNASQLCHILSFIIATNPPSTSVSSSCMVQLYSLLSWQYISHLYYSLSSHILHLDSL